MADGLDYRILNGAAFEAALAGDAAAVKDLKGPLAAAASELVSAAQGAAPHRSGHLAGAHRAQPAQASKVRLVVDTPYAAVIHWGWPGHGIRRQEWLVATWYRNPVPVEKMTRELQSSFDKEAART